MAILMSFFWGAICSMSLFAALRLYIPVLQLQQGVDELEKNTGRNEHVRNLIYALFFTTSIITAMICGYISGMRQDDLINIFKMVGALCVLSVISITDIALYKIPNACVLILLVLRIASIVPELFINDRSILQGLLNSCIAGIVSLIFLLFVSKITHGGIGLGDVKLFGAFGFLCGVNATVYTLVLSFLFSAIVSVVLLITKKKQLKDGLPMGPFIWFGFALSIILGLC